MAAVRLAGQMLLKDEAWVEMPDGLILPASMAEMVFRKQRRPIGIDLFAGCGGFSLGYIQAGFTVVAALDNDPLCAMTYMHNLGTYPCQFHFIATEDQERTERVFQREFKRIGCDPNKRSKEIVPAPVPMAGQGWIKHQPASVQGVEHFFLGDIRKITGKEILKAIGIEQGEVDCVMGGPPCQGFTTAGKRDVMDPRNSLVFEFARLVCEIHPKTIVMENVPGIINMVTPEGMPVVEAFARILEKGDYSEYANICKALTEGAGTGGKFIVSQRMSFLRYIGAKHRIALIVRIIEIAVKAI